jgi:uncharacterized ion transporter superfamily protein YfcC
MTDSRDEPLVSAEQHVDSFTGGSSARRGWTLVVACAGVALVIASMIALNTALSDIASATSATQTQMAWVVDSYTLVLACLLLPAWKLVTHTAGAAPYSSDWPS